MIVGIDNIAPGLSTTSAGVGGMRAWLEDLLDGLPAALPTWQFKLFTPEWSEPFSIRHPNLQVVVCKAVPTSRTWRVWFEQADLPQLIAAHAVDIWLGTVNTLPLLAKCRKLLVIQSLQCFTQPESFGFLRRHYLRQMIRWSVRNAHITVAISEDSRRCLLELVPVPPASVQVVYNRWVDLAARAGNAALDTLPDPYILCVSALYPYKNHRRLIEGFSRLLSRFPGLRLVIAGGQDSSELRKFAKALGVETEVVFTGKVSDAQLVALYRGARLMAMPSLEETFGLPVLEAMGFDCPVLTSNLSSMAEIAGDAAILVDPRDVSAIERGLLEILTNENLRKTLIARGRERCRFFTTERMIEGFAHTLRGMEEGL